MFISIRVGQLPHTDQVNFDSINEMIKQSKENDPNKIIKVNCPNKIKF